MNREALKKQLMEDEDVRLKPYRDTVGKLTVGCGRNLDDRGIRMSEAMFMLENDIDEVVRELDRVYPWWNQLTDRRQQVLCNMAFNLGMTRLAGFRKMLSFLNEGKYNEAANEMTNSKWAKQVGIRAARLAMMMRNG
jgi:lysozyme